MRHRDRSGEVLVAIEDGVIKVRTVRRKGREETSWDESDMGAVKGAPWEPIPGREVIEVKSRAMLPDVAWEVSEAREFARGDRAKEKTQKCEEGRR